MITFVMSASALVLFVLLSLSLSTTAAAAGSSSDRHRSRRVLHGPDLIEAHRRFESQTRSAFELINSSKKRNPQQQKPKEEEKTDNGSSSISSDSESIRSSTTGSSDTTTNINSNRSLSPAGGAPPTSVKQEEDTTVSNRKVNKATKKMAPTITTIDVNDNDNDNMVVTMQQQQQCKIELNEMEQELATMTQNLFDAQTDLDKLKEELEQCQEILEEEETTTVESTQLYVQMAKSCTLHREENTNDADADADANNKSYRYYLTSSEFSKDTWEFSDRPLRTERTIPTDYFMRGFEEVIFTEATGGAPNAAFTFINLDDDKFDGPLVSIMIKASRIDEDDVIVDNCDIDNDGDQDFFFTDCITYTYELEQSKDQAGIISLESFFGKDYQDDPNRVEYDDCSIFIDSVTTGTSEFDAVKLEGPCCNCISFNDKMDCTKYGNICVECSTIVTEAEGFSMNVYWPIIQNDTTMKLPLPVLSWNHGLNNDGTKLDKLRRNMFVFLANLGFVVVAHRLDHGWPDENADYQLKAIEKLYLSNEFGHLAERGGKTVLAGYSMGGAGSLNSANKGGIVNEYNVKAALVFMPWIIDRCKQGGDHIPIVPTMFQLATRDIIAPYDNGYSIYYRMTLTNKVVVGRNRQSHMSPDNFLVDDDSSMEYSIANFLQCEVFDDESSCIQVYGSEDISNSGHDGVPYDITYTPGKYPDFDAPVEEYATRNLEWADNGYTYDRGKTQKYRITGSRSCDDNRDCKGRSFFCSQDCINIHYCGSTGAPFQLDENCQKCK